MKRITRTAQTGYALIMMVLLLMGVGGVVLAGFTQNAKQDLHNQRVLKEAKQALLQYAFNYPANNPDRGPGRLPCPDIDNDGLSTSPFNCESGGALVGRLPWRDDDLNFYDARDADGNRLWYAVSKRFARSISPPADDVINSATRGSITVRDRTGALLYDASSVPSTGVAAVIIAPGPVIARNGTAQDRSVSNSDLRFDTNPDSDPGIINPVNYLDLFGTLDNADFVNDNQNGFVTGPIYNPVDGSLAVNDQMIVITAAEVIAMAEKATLRAYRDAISDYLLQVRCIGETPEGSGMTQAVCVANGGTWSDVYPWLYNYKDVVTFEDLSELYPAFTSFVTESDYLSNYGRIPSIFADYFVLEPDSLPIESELTGTLRVNYGGLTLSSASGPLAFNDGLHTLNFPIAGILPDVRFLDDLGAPNGRLTATVAGPQIFNQALYFWDLDHGTTGFWTACPAGGDQLSDCHRDSGSNPIPGGDNNIKLEILRVDLQIVIPDGQVTFDANYGTAPTIAVTSRADAGSHATIAGTYAASNMDFIPATAPVITATYQIDRHYHEEDDDPPSGEGFIVEEAGTLTVAELLGTTTMTLEMRYYPELPRWALDNEWHNSIRMAYADTYLPTTAAECVPPPGVDNCLTLPEERGAPRNIASLLVIAGQHDWVDGDADGMADELRDVFDNGNHNDNRSFYTTRSISPLNSDRGNDHLLVIEEL